MNEITILVLIAVVGLVGSFVQSASGFGYAIVFMTFVPMLIPFPQASVLELITAFVMVIYLTVRLRKHIVWKLLWPPAIICVLFSIVGVGAMMKLSDEVLSKILGIALLVLAFYFIFLSDKIRIKPTLVSGLVAGTISGLSGGLFNIGGPPMVAYYMAVSKDKESYNATLQAYFCITTISTFIIHIFNGNVTSEIIPLGLAALAGTAIGTIIGYFVFRKLTLKGIKRFVYVFMIISGVYLLAFN